MTSIAPTTSHRPMIVKDPKGKLTEADLRKWAKSRKIFLNPECAFLEETQTMGCGIFAKKGIPKGQMIISCPHSAYIAPMDDVVEEAPSAAAIAEYVKAHGLTRDPNTTSNNIGDSVGDGCESGSISIPSTSTVYNNTRAGDSGSYGISMCDWTRTVLRLMSEVSRRDSPWRPWLRCCPEMPDHLFDVPLPPCDICEGVYMSVCPTAVNTHVSPILSCTPGAQTTVTTPILSGKAAAKREAIFGLPPDLKACILRASTRMHANSGQEVTHDPSITSSSSSSSSDILNCFAVVTGIAQELKSLDIVSKWEKAKPLVLSRGDIWITPKLKAPPVIQVKEDIKDNDSNNTLNGNTGNTSTSTISKVDSSTNIRKEDEEEYNNNNNNKRRLTETYWWQQFMQCAAQVTSRNFHRESQERPGPYLLPIIDFLNHSSHRSNVEFTITRKKHAYQFVVLSSRDISPNEQLFHNYGSLTAARFLTEFQFVSHSKALEEDITLRFSAECLGSLVSLLMMRNPELSRRCGTGNNNNNNLSYSYFYNRTISRVRKLTNRDLFFFDEGLFLTDEVSMSKRIYGDKDNNTIDIMCKETRFRTEALRVVLLLLCCNDYTFNALFPFLSRYWVIKDLIVNMGDIAPQEPNGPIVLNNILGANINNNNNNTVRNLKGSTSVADDVSSAPKIPFLLSPLEKMGNSEITTSQSSMSITTVCELTKACDTIFVIPILQIRLEVTRHQINRLEEQRGALSSGIASEENNNNNSKKGSVFRTEKTDEMVLAVLKHEERLLITEIEETKKGIENVLSKFK